MARPSRRRRSCLRRRRCGRGRPRRGCLRPAGGRRRGGQRGGSADAEGLRGSVVGDGEIAAAGVAEDLLTIAQTDRGELPIRPERAAASEIIGEVASRFARRAEDAGRPLEVDVETDLRLEADRPRLGQALGNMLDNALRYGAGPVSLMASAHDGFVELHVLDRGPGLSEEFRERAFERFSRPSASRSDGGSGLGLAIVEAIAHAHGGAAHLADRPGGGADVWLTLPEARSPSRRG